MPKVLQVDPTKCIGCHSCEMACSTGREGQSSLQRSRIRVISFGDDFFHYPNVCVQCEVPYCALVCPSGGLQKDLETGVVELFGEKCTGCKMCISACPFGAISLIDGRAFKCDLCQGEPLCVRFCDRQALVFADPDDASLAKGVQVASKVKALLQGVKESHMSGRATAYGDMTLARAK